MTFMGYIRGFSRLTLYFLHRNIDEGLFNHNRKFLVHGKLLIMNKSQTTSKDLDYQDLQELMNKSDAIVIDVREHKEIQETGKLPGSIHIPLGELKHALESMSPEKFKQKYGIEKPKPETIVCFSCRSGNRSKKALDIAMELGFQNACHYAGGFMDWQKHNSS